MPRPFDPTAASLYGEFVQAAYTMYGAAPENPTPPPSSDFPDGYRLVAWIQMRDFIIESTKPQFYGFVAQSAANANDFVVAIRGTADVTEWWDDINAIGKTPFKIPDCGMVGDGFARIYDTLEVIEAPAGAPRAAAAAPRSLRTTGAFSAQISALVRRRTPAPRASGRSAARVGALPPAASIDVTGHSLGAALATLYVMENAHTEQIANPLLCTFASPLVGDATFASIFNALGLTSWRVDNLPDLVTKVPPPFLGFVHVNTEVPFNSFGKVTPSLVCWHSLSTYLSLIDPAKHPDPGCRLPAVAAAGAVEPAAAAAIAAPALSRPTESPHSAAPVFRPVVIDINHGDNVQDTPGPLGGFERVKASGIAFLIHKATEGLTFADPRYKARRAAWMNGIPVPVTDVTGEVLQITPRFAAYHFFHGEDPEAEARFFLETARLQPGDDAVIDWEAVPGSGYVPTADEADRFCNVVEEALGFPVIVYSGNAAKEQIRGKDPRFAKRRLWLAQYSRTFSVQESWTHPWLWQNNGGQRGGNNSIPGMDGNCDNSTVASPMTVKDLVDTWGGGAQAIAALTTAPAAIPRVQVMRGARIVESSGTVTRRKIARYGWKPDLPDQRDYSYAVPSSIMRNFPPSVDLRPQCPAVYNQGFIGSCTANAIAAALEFDMMKQKMENVFTPSRLFIYYNERTMEGTVGSDSGAYIRDGIKSVAGLGDCPETEWTYDGTAAGPGGVFAPGAKAAIRPSDQCFADAVPHTAMSYQSVDQNLTDLRGCLASGFPFVFGFTVYTSFESDSVAHNGIVPVPASDETMVGGHAVLAVGYDDSKGMFIVRNSWGAGWGIGGYCYMPYSYLLDDNLANDFWTIRLVG